MAAQGGKKTVFIWRKSVYDNNFTCKCGAKLTDKDGWPTDNVGVNSDDESDNRLFCVKCMEFVGVYKETTEDVKGGGLYPEEKLGGLTEIEAWGFGVGNLSMNPLYWKSNREFMRLLKKQKGLLGVHPHYPDGNILIFDTENNAKGSRNILRSKGVSCGEIGKMFVDSRYLTKGKK